jgi:hypothetical protein
VLRTRPLRPLRSRSQPHPAKHLAQHTFISTWAIDAPMQRRTPPPNGIQA